jgi:serine/threonine-protein kinase
MPKKSTKTRTIAIAALATLAVASGAGLYLSGLMTPATPNAGKTSLSAAEPSKPAPETSKPTSTDKVANVPEPAVQPVQPQPAKPAELPSQTEQPAKPPAMKAQPQTEASAPPAGSQADANAVQTPEPAKPTVPVQTEAPSNSSATDAQQPSEKTPSAQPEAVESPKPEPETSQPAAPKVAAPAPKPTASQTDAANAESQTTVPPAAKQPDQPVVALNVPKPAVPPAVDDIAQRVSWVRDFGGGDCFYATMNSSTDTAAAIEGFGTAVQPFERMLSDFQAKFHVEPDISVRLIEPSQCEVTNFLRFLGQTAADKPQLVLDRTSVPNGTPISGTLVTRGGLISSVLLIDHKGMVFNLDDRIVAQSDKATFSIPIGLGAADKAAGKAVPQIIMVITGPQDIQAAAFSTPTPASVLLPKILEEIETDGSQFSATAKYFRLGG